ncbi:MAG: glycosyltransferase [Lachnospiraceae bacterium]
MNKPLISIIVPVYNAEKYLDDCLESLVNQTYDNTEIILVDDGSSDGSGSICERYAKKDKRIVFISKKNGGVGSARNAGLAVAKGEYVFFCDSDDMVKYDLLEKSYETAAKENAEIVIFGVVTVNDSRKHIKEDHYIKKADYSNIKDSRILFAEMKKNDEYSSCVQYMLLKRSVIRRKFIHMIHEDELFTPQVLYEAEKAVFIPDELYIRKIHDNSVTTTRKSAENYTAMVHVIAGLEKIENKDSVLVSHLCDLYRTINVIYSKLEKEEKIKAKDTKAKADKHFIKMMICADPEYRKYYRHAVLSKIYHAGKY